MGHIRALDLTEPAFAPGVSRDLCFGTGRGGNTSTVSLVSIIWHGLDSVLICAGAVYRPEVTA